MSVQQCPSRERACSLQFRKLAYVYACVYASLPFPFTRRLYVANTRNERTHITIAFSHINKFRRECKRIVYPYCNTHTHNVTLRITLKLKLCIIFETQQQQGFRALTPHFYSTVIVLQSGNIIYPGTLI